MFNTPNKGLTLVYRHGKAGDKTASTSHGGIDGAVDTMNSVLTDIVGDKPKYPFTKAILDY